MFRSTQQKGHVEPSLLFCAPVLFANRISITLASYTCGTYHRRGTAGCTTHHIRVDKLDERVKLDQPYSPYLGKLLADYYDARSVGA